MLETDDEYKKNDNEGEKVEKGEPEVLVLKEEPEMLKGEDNTKGIIQKRLKILVIDGEVSGAGGANWGVAKALIGNGTGKEVEFNDAWSTKADLENKYLKEEGKWKTVPLCYAENADSASAVKCLGPNQAASIETYSVDANVVVIVDSDKLQEDVLKDKNFQDMIQYKKVISYGNGNKTLDADYLGKEGYKSKYVHLDSEEGCKNLLDFIQNSVDSNDEEKFIGKGILHKMKKYAKENKKKTAAGGIAGFVTFGEEFVGQLFFGKSILGAVFGYNSNSKEKNGKDVKDNKDAKKEKNKEVNNSGNQVK